MTDLAALFDDFNRLYFGGRLPKYRIRLCRRLVAHRKADRDTIKYGAVGLTDRKRRLIQILANGDEAATLLHEMVHAAVGYGHGTAFGVELERIKSMGAPIGAPRTEAGERVTAARVRNNIEDALAEGASLRRAQEWAARGAGWPRAELVRRFPRASIGR